MKEKEIELAMEGLFRGAQKVRARRNAKKFSSNAANRTLTPKITSQAWKEGMNDPKVA